MMIPINYTMFPFKSNHHNRKLMDNFFYLNRETAWAMKGYIRT